jgi:dihydropteroate synthase
LLVSVENAPSYRDVVSEVKAFLQMRIEAALKAGVKVFRVHDVWQNRQAADVAWVMRENKSS